MKNAANAMKTKNSARPPCNIVVAGLGGQGVLTATDIIADVALRAGFDVKKSEIKGMSQRGGSVTCDVRFGGPNLQPHGAGGRGGFSPGARTGAIGAKPASVAFGRHDD